MEERVLFPSQTDWKYARLIQRDGDYVIQSKYDEQTKRFQQEVIVERENNVCPELLAFNIYCDTLCNAVGKKLRKRPEYAEWLKENQIRQEQTEANQQAISNI